MSSLKSQKLKAEQEIDTIATNLAKECEGQALEDAISDAEAEIASRRT